MSVQFEIANETDAGVDAATEIQLVASFGVYEAEYAAIRKGVGVLHEPARGLLELRGKDAKSGTAAIIPLRPDVINELHICMDARGDDLPADAKLLPRPPRIVVFDADCQAAGIAKSDVRGRQVDIHALRHTFGTHLSAVGVRARTAMAAMRHSRIELTMNYYTDPALLDVAGAMNSLPDFSSGQSDSANRAAKGA